MTEREILDIINANKLSSVKQVEKLSPNAVERFNELYKLFLKRHPDYDPMATDDYDGPQDSEFLDMLEKVVNIDSISLLEGLLPTFENYYLRTL